MKVVEKEKELGGGISVEKGVVKLKGDGMIKVGDGKLKG